MSLARPALRRATARLAGIAILFQAVLFGWHHHDLPIRGQLPLPVVENAAAVAQPADDADGCEICQVLHHLFAAAPDIGDPPPSPGTVAVAAQSAAARLSGSRTLAFRARAPPTLA
ncbi:MAG TPA: hypothetical protein VMB84_02575 [Stellaceae bacterium]|nr:hypothetical protein [Stellaceae bacterium]